MSGSLLKGYGFHLLQIKPLRMDLASLRMAGSMKTSMPQQLLAQRLTGLLELMQQEHLPVSIMRNYPVEGYRLRPLQLLQKGRMRYRTSNQGIFMELLP